MASQVRFDPSAVEGLVASGTKVSDAAERLGVTIELACGGQGECTSCAVRMLENPFALSEVAEAERAQLGEERIAAGYRLACQAYVREGDCVIHVEHPGASAASAGEAEASNANEDSRKRILDAFDELPTSDRIATALELQMRVAGDLLSTIVDVPLKAGEELFASIFGSAGAEGLVGRGRAHGRHARRTREAQRGAT